MSVATASVATHSRFKCAICGAKIEKNTAMLHVKEDNQKVHVKCAGSVLDKKVTSDQIKELESLEQADQDAILALVTAVTKPSKAPAAVNASGRPKRAASGKKRAQEDDGSASPSVSEDVSETKPKKKAAAPKKAKPAAAASKKRSKKDEEDDEEDEEEDESEEETKPAKKAKAAPKPKFTLPADVQAKIDAAEEALQSKTQEQLKDLCRKNDQAFSKLTVKELIQKIADQQVRGKIPRCPKCFGGKLRCDFKGKYTCPGYANDEGKYRRCIFTANESEITREPWQDV